MLNEQAYVDNLVPLSDEEKERLRCSPADLASQATTPKSAFSATRMVGAYDLPDGWVQFRMAVSRGEPGDEMYGPVFGRFDENGKMLEWSVRGPSYLSRDGITDVILS